MFSSRITPFLLAACVASAGPTVPGDQYLLYLKRSPEAIWAYGLCFTDSSVYFHDREDSARKFIALSEVRFLERDTRMDGLRGAGIAAGLIVAGTVANYYLGGGNAPGVMWDRKEGHILAGMGLVALGSPLGMMIGEVLGKEELYHWKEPGGHAARSQGYACGGEIRVDTLPRSGTTAEAVDRDPAARNPGPGMAGSTFRPGERELGRQDGYRDLKPQIDSQYLVDSAWFRSERKLRFLVMVGGTPLSVADAMIDAELYRIAASRMLYAHKKSLVSATLGFSRISTLEETDSRYMLELLGGSESPLGRLWWLHTQGGVRTFFPFRIGEDIAYLPVLIMGVHIGVSWKWERSLLYVEGTFHNLDFPGLRAGAGFGF